MDLYFQDVDTYITVDESEFETAELGIEVISAVAEAADLADEGGFTELAKAIDQVMVKVAAEYRGKTVTLNKPFRTPGGPKKFSVYVKNDRGNVVKVNFGDPNMKIKKNIPERRRSFRARHNCDSPGPKWKARYWSCRAW